MSDILMFVFIAQDYYIYDSCQNGYEMLYKY